MKNSGIKIYTKTLIGFCVFLLTAVCPALQAQKIPPLKFDKTGKFKILQFTDAHLKPENKPRCDSVITIMKSVIEAEKPNLVVLTGDIATSENVENAWLTVTKPMAEAGIPWAAVFGNHDFEHGFTNRRIMEYLQTLPYNLSINGPDDINGSGNYTLEIENADGGKTGALLYFFDSNAYTSEKNNKELGHYDWIKFNQIAWYRKTSETYTLKNNGKPYPALAFFHIPLPEYAAVQKKAGTIGDKDENVSSPVVNSGMYCAFLEEKDVMAAFCGHDHENNYIGALNGIALAYGCKTGKDAYGKLDKGGRVIVLYQGERKFDTWLHTTNDPVKYLVKYPETFNK